MGPFFYIFVFLTYTRNHTESWKIIHKIILNYQQNAPCVRVFNIFNI